MSDAFKNILIIKPSALGDVVQALPALAALRKTFPEAEISWLVRPEFAPLIEDHPDLTHIIPFDRKRLGRAWFHPGALAALLALLYRLRREKFDVVFDFQGLLRSALFARITGCKDRFGVADAREFARHLYTCKIPNPPDSIHVVDHYMSIVHAAGVEDLAVEFKLPSNPAAEAHVAKLLAAHDVAPKKYVVFIPGSAHLQKCWPIDRFAALARRIAAERNLALIVTGSAFEAHLGQTLDDLTDIAITNLAGKTSVPQLVALLKDAAIVVSNDTGPGHIAAAVGAPLVMIFGKSNPARVAPYNQRQCVVAAEPDARGPLPDSTDPKHDITEITVEQVYEKLIEQLAL